MPVFRKAGFFWGRCVLRPLGFAGIALSPKLVYLLPEHFDDPVLRAHEEMHCFQMERDGFMWWFMAGYYLARYGYRNSPYEIEARLEAIKVKVSQRRAA